MRIQVRATDQKPPGSRRRNQGPPCQQSLICAYSPVGPPPGPHFVQTGKAGNLPAKQDLHLQATLLFSPPGYRYLKCLAPISAFQNRWLGVPKLATELSFPLVRRAFSGFVAKTGHSNDPF